MSGSKQDDSGLMSNAGLVRYFDEDAGIGINPKTFVAFTVFVGIMILMLNFAF